MKSGYTSTAMSAAVEDILQRINALSEEERRELDEALLKSRLADWDESLEGLRAEVKAKGITDDDINNWIAELRYGKTATDSK